MSYTFKEMTKEAAVIISHWEYPSPYNFYNMDPDEEGVAELMNGDYFCVTDGTDHIAGFFCFGLSARVPGGYAAGLYIDEQRLDIGLGMNPALTGQGLGSEFVQEGLQWLQRQHGQSTFRLVVASFNERAKRVYAENGFVPRGTVLSKINGEEVEFLYMEADL